MVKTHKKEAHFFDQSLFNVEANNISETKLEMVRKDYAETYFYPTLLDKITRHDDTIELPLHAFEKTPFYMFDPLVPERIRVVCPWAKVIILLRDPVARAYSAYKMNRQNDKIRYGNTTFESVIEQEVDILNRIGILDQNFLDLDEDKRQTKWRQYWEWYTMKKKYADAFIGRGLYCLQLEMWYKYYQDEARKNILIVKSESLAPNTTTNEVNLKSITDYIGVSEYNFISKPTERIHKSKDIGQIKTETQEYLQRLFEPFNKRLHSMLGEGWEDPWPYLNRKD